MKLLEPFFKGSNTLALFQRLCSSRGWNLHAPILFQRFSKFRFLVHSVFSKTLFFFGFVHFPKRLVGVPFPKLCHPDLSTVPFPKQLDCAFSKAPGPQSSRYWSTAAAKVGKTMFGFNLLRCWLCLDGKAPDALFQTLFDDLAIIVKNGIGLEVFTPLCLAILAPLAPAGVNPCQLLEACEVLVSSCTMFCLHVDST